MRFGPLMTGFGPHTTGFSPLTTISSLVYHFNPTVLLLFQRTQDLQPTVSCMSGQVYWSVMSTELVLHQHRTNTKAPFQYTDILSSYLTGMGNSHVKGKTAGKTSFR